MAEENSPESQKEDVGPSQQEPKREAELVENLHQAVGAPSVDSDSILSLTKSLAELIGISRPAEGRARLAKLQIVKPIMGLLRRFKAATERGTELSVEASYVLLLILKLSRNLCAGDPVNQDAFLEGGGVAALLAPVATTQLSAAIRTANIEPTRLDHESETKMERITAQFGSARISPEKSPASVSRRVRCLELMLQLLGNFSRRGDESQACVWEVFFPGVFLDLSSLRLHDICGPLCMVLYTCCKENEARCWQLCQGDGAALIAMLMVWTVEHTPDLATVDHPPSNEGNIDWFELLVQDLCMEKRLFPVLFTTLGIPPLTQRLNEDMDEDEDEVIKACQRYLETSTLTSVQCGLLYILCDRFTKYSKSGQLWDVIVDEKQQAGKSEMPPKSLSYMVGIIRRAAQSSTSNTGGLPSVAVQVLEAALLLLRMACALDRKPEDENSCAKALVTNGLIEILLDMLRSLGPPRVPGDSFLGKMEERSADVSETEGQLPSKNLYDGYRRDIVAVIANISHKNVLVQDRVRNAGSLVMMLQQCVVEFGNPFLREWGLWAMRNLLEDNEKNQEEIAELEFKQAVDLPELRRMGLNFKVDPDTGKPRLVNEGSSTILD